MKVVIDKEKGKVFLYATNFDETKDFFNITRILRPQDTLEYLSRTEIGTKHALFFCIKDLRDSSKFTVSGDTEQDNNVVAQLRNICFRANGGKLIFLEVADLEGCTVLVCAGEICQHCNTFVIDETSCAARVCHKCAEFCKHVYGSSVMTGPNILLAECRQCENCGRIDPESIARVERSR